MLGSRAEDPDVAIWTVLNETRERGYGINAGKTEPDITAVGVAVLDPMARVRGALTVAGLSCRLAAPSLELIGTSLREKAQLLGAQLVGHCR
jgi:DNA-binding IclR family transcriptional regulator